MILNTGARTDTVQYYTEWLLNRFKEGFVLVRNPLFSIKVTRYELTPDKVEAIQFCSKNDTEESIKTLIELSNLAGRKRVSWRYDPILLTKDYTIEKHVKTFDYMAKQLAPYIDRCIFSFVEMYKKLANNMPEIILLNDNDKEILAENLGKIAEEYGIHLQTCGTNGDYSKYNIHKSGCMTLDIMAKANNIKFKNLKHKGSRAGCHCIETHDIGAYDTCLNGCKYCYANQNPKKAFENYKFHNSKSPLLLGEVKPDDIIQQGNQKSMLIKL